MGLKIISACDKNHLYGVNNELPWRADPQPDKRDIIDDDMMMFRQKTIGHTVIMGRLTYESIGRPLPSRTNIVVSSLYPLQQALSDHPDAWIIGGKSIIMQVLDLCPEDVDAVFINILDMQCKSSPSSIFLEVDLIKDICEVYDIEFNLQLIS
jgi:dihydrofolate reductase